MFRTKKGKLITISILIIIIIAGALCAYTLLTENPGQETVGGDTAPSSSPTKAADITLPPSPSVGSAPEEVGNPSPAVGISDVPVLTDAPVETPLPTPTLDSSPSLPENTPTPTVNVSSAPNLTDAPVETPLPTQTPDSPPDLTDPPEETLPPAPTNPAASPQDKTPAPTPTKAPTPKPSATPLDGSTSTNNSTSTNGSVSANGQLQVIGTQLSNAAGSPIVLRGVSTHGIAWFPDFATKAFMQTLKEEWNATVFRIAMYSSEGNDSYINNPAWNKTKVCSLIDAAIDLDMYVIVDWHILADGNPQTYQKQASEFFTYIASTYAGIPNILYEICNEPNGGTTWGGNIKPYANEIIPIIRAYSPDAVIIVGTPTWSQDVDAAAADPLPYDNLLYSLHFYAGTHKEWLRNKADAALAKGLPIFATEWGTTDASGNGAVDKASSNEWLSYLEKQQISWCNWSLCNKPESSALLLPSAKTLGAMPDSALTESGKYIKGKLLEYSGTTPVEQETQDPTDSPAQKVTPAPSPAASDKPSPTKPAGNTSGQKPSTSDPAGLTLLYYNENREDSTNTISPRFQIKNNTGNDIPLDKLSILYYYTPEKEVTQCFFCDYAEVNGSSYRAITSSINGTYIDGKDSCMEITFTPDAGILAAGDTATLQVRITNEDWSNYNQSDDASFSSTATTYMENDHAALISK